MTVCRPAPSRGPASSRAGWPSSTAASGCSATRTPSGASGPTWSSSWRSTPNTCRTVPVRTTRSGSSSWPWQGPPRHMNPTAIVVACNTASVHGLAALREPSSSRTSTISRHRPGDPPGCVDRRTGGDLVHRGHVVERLPPRPCRRLRAGHRDAPDRCARPRRGHRARRPGRDRPDHCAAVADSPRDVQRPRPRLHPLRARRRPYRCSVEPTAGST